MTLVQPTAPVPLPESRPARSVLTVLRRRWWVLLVSAVLGGAVALLISMRSTSNYQAEAVVVVPAVVPGQLPPGSPDAAIKLAQTYATLIPLDDEIVAQAAAKAGVTPAQMTKSLTVANDAGTALIRIDTTSSSPAQAVASAAAVASVITRTSPPGQISNGSIKLVSLPTAAVALSETGRSAGLLGGLLGLIVGFIIVAALERSDRRIDRLADLSALTTGGVSEWRDIDPAQAAALSTRWTAVSGTPGPVIAFVPCGSLGREDVEAMLGELAEGGAHHRREKGATGKDVARPEPTLRATGRPGGDGSAELVAQDADLVVVVVAQGTPVRQVVAALSTLQQFGVRVGWALLTPSGRRRARPATTGASTA